MGNLKTVRVSIIALFFLFSVTCTAQKTKDLRCEGPKRNSEKVTVRLNSGYLDIEAGIKQSFLYNNKEGNLNNGYSFVAKPKQYLGINYNIPLTSKFEGVIGVEYAQNKHGLALLINDNGDKITEKNYSVSTLWRFSLGSSYFINPSWKISVSPILLYSTYVATQTTGSYQFSDGVTSITSYGYDWNEQDRYDVWYMGFDVKTKIKIHRRFHLDIIASLDFKPSVPLSGEAYLTYQDGSERIFYGSINPYLFYLGGGFSYRIF